MLYLSDGSWLCFKKNLHKSRQPMVHCQWIIGWHIRCRCQNYNLKQFEQISFQKQAESGSTTNSSCLDHNWSSSWRHLKALTQEAEAGWMWLGWLPMLKTLAKSKCSSNIPARYSWQHVKKYHRPCMSLPFLALTKNIKLSKTNTIKFNSVTA